MDIRVFKTFLLQRYPYLSMLLRREPRNVEKPSIIIHIPALRLYHSCFYCHYCLLPLLPRCDASIGNAMPPQLEAVGASPPAILVSAVCPSKEISHFQKLTKIEWEQ
jgi:hypothetical protein